ncbi:MAG: LemA family protein [Ferruginibacter sp.]|jgi:LemA protein|nr:LemA family protein [Chitinophagaceae bacterium]
MSTSTILLIAAGGGVFIMLIGLISVFNELAKERILTQEGASGISTCLQQRNDLIPNLVETVKGYAGHENNTLIEVVKWRNQSVAATTVDEQNVVAKGLNQALFNMLSLTENYPELKADKHFQEMMGQLASIEEKINDSRRYYNGTVREYNQSLAVFPKNIVAGIFSYKPAAFFAEDAGAKVAPKVAFQ